MLVLTIVQGHSTMVYGQDIPIGTWRLHVSYADIHSISVTPTKIYAAAPNGVMILDLADDNITTLTKLDGLSSTNITQIIFDQQQNQLLITYADGDIDIVKGNGIINFNTLKNSATISGSKRINHISIQGSLAYLSTDFGVVVFDLVQLAIKETWRDIGTGGAELEINQSTFHNDSIYLATEKGVLAGKLNDNLLDYNNWNRFASGTFSGDISSITTFSNKVFVAVDGAGIYKYGGASWQLQPYLQSLNYTNITTGEVLLVTTDNDLYAVSETDVVTEVESANIIKPKIAFTDDQGNYWIGDGKTGLVSNKPGFFSSYTANGPTFSKGFRLVYYNQANVLFAVSGGFNNSLLPLGNSAQSNFFKDGDWVEQSQLISNDLTDVGVVGNAVFTSSYGFGLERSEGSSSSVYDESNSPLRNVSADNTIRVTAIENSSNGLWVTNAGVSQALHLLKTNNTWESFSFPDILAARYPTDIKVDYLGNVWMVINPSNGGGIVVFNKTTGKSVYLTKATNSGGLPSELVYSIAMDRDGFVWIGTDEGVAYFPDPSSVFRPAVNAIKPVFENRFLLRDERVTAIEVDGGNRKWMGTENGIWLFNEFGEAQVYNFNETNSPLLSDKIVDLEINDQSGELFIITDAGIASFRSDATEGQTSSNIKIFPNPVTNQFNGQVGISGLATDAIVKITDVAGKLVWQSKANGGSAAWNVRDYNGRRASTGIYLVFCISQDGLESMVGKIAIVN